MVGSVTLGDWRFHAYFESHAAMVASYIATLSRAMPRVNNGAATFCASICCDASCIHRYPGGPASQYATWVRVSAVASAIRFLIVCISAAEAAALGGVESRIRLTAGTTQVFHVPAVGSTWAQSPAAESALTTKNLSICKI